MLFISRSPTVCSLSWAILSVAIRSSHRRVNISRAGPLVLTPFKSTAKLPRVPPTFHCVVAFDSFRINID